MRNIGKRDIVQIQRKNFYICDEKTETSLVLIEIPDGKETKKGPEAVGFYNNTQKSKIGLFLCGSDWTVSVWIVVLYFP